VRTATRSYRGAATDYRRARIYRALHALEGVQLGSAASQVLPEEELHQVYARLSLSNDILGGFVRKESLERLYETQMLNLEAARAANWDLLRQQAELCGLYFEPLATAEGTPGQVILWIDRSDLIPRGRHYFSGQFLRISDPWTDKRLLNWSGYKQVRYLDASNRLVLQEGPSTRRVEMIPLALYSLDYPRVPLLLVDFRHLSRPKLAELGAQTAHLLLAGVLGVTRLSNWPYLAASSAWTFVRERHGAAVDRSARMQSYSGARDLLSVETNLDPKLKAELVRGLEGLAPSPFESTIAAEGAIAREQYVALLQYARSPGGLTEKLASDRAKEAEAYGHSAFTRMLIDAGDVITRGPRVHAGTNSASLAELSSHRRADYHVRFLRSLLASSTCPEVMREPALIRRSVDALASEEDPSSQVPRLLAEVFERSQDSDLRAACLRSLARMHVKQARAELQRLAGDPGIASSWRGLAWRALTGSVPVTLRPPASAP